MPADDQRGGLDGVAVAVGVLGPHDAPRAVVRRGRSPKRMAVVLPPAAAQCGYSFDDSLDSPFHDGDF